jgi:hypothetical protein
VKIYEIRIMAGRQAGPDIYSGSHLNDHAAVRRAMMLVKPHQWIEVWCGVRCVYAGSPAPSGMMVQPREQASPEHRGHL